jgi:uncharacterized protein YjdB
MAGGARASIGIDAQIVALAANAVNVRVTYSLKNGARTTMIDSTVSIKRNANGDVDWVGDRGFPVEIDLAPCLIDPEHQPAGTGCLIGVVARLLENATQIDIITIDPFKVEPGKLTVVEKTVVLREVGTVTIDPPVQLLRVGDAATLGVRLVDVAGNQISERPVAWRSDNSNVARISTDGVVSAVGPGKVTLTARAGTREGSVTLTVAPK